MGRPKKQTIRKEEIAEDYCFHCKDGGNLRICDYKNCLKSYHPRCVGSEDSLLEAEDNWFCKWHSCFNCPKLAKFHCFTCPYAVCGRCIWEAEFVSVKRIMGFCNTCSELTLLIEDKKNVNSNGEQVDFNDRGTYEFLFKEYWKLLKEKEGLTSEQVHSSFCLLRDGKNFDLQATISSEENASDFEDENDQFNLSDNDGLNNKQLRCRKKKKVKLPLTKSKGNPKKREFFGWASKELIEFLTFAGKSMMQEWSQYDVASIVIQYCNEHNLFHPKKKRKIICDERLKSLLGRKTVHKNGIYKLLTDHFAENLEDSEDSVEFTSKEDKYIIMPCKRQQKTSHDQKQKLEENEKALDIKQGHLAAIVSRNIKLVYLKRSLVQELAKQLDTFYVKIMGSFVRVKKDPNDYMQRNSHMLVQVKGIKEEINSVILLQVSNMVNHVPVCKLSDDNFTEEECEDLYQRMKAGRLKMLTVLELEQKARSLHEDITKHWIMKEQVLLQNQINRANEKGWRRELVEYTDRLLLLQTPSEQSRLIDEIPEVVAEPKPASRDSPREDKKEDKAASEGTLNLVTRIESCILKNGGVSSCQDDAEGKQQHTKVSNATVVKADEPERNQLCQGVIQNRTETFIPPKSLLQESSDGQSNRAYPENRPCEQTRVEVIELSDDEVVDTRVAVSRQPCEDPDSSILHSIISPHRPGKQIKVEEVIELSDEVVDTGVAVSPQPCDDRDSSMQHSISPHQRGEQTKVTELSDEVVDTSVAVSHLPCEDRDSYIWYSLSPHGNITGPYSMNLLKEWNDSRTTKSAFKVLKSGQRPEEAVLLTDVLQQVFNS